VAEVGPTIFARHEFLIRRLHSLTGLMFGGYMVVHLLTNASVLGGAAMFQKNVLAIHGFGPLLPVLEWGLIFLPILFHAIVGLFLLFEMIPNTRNYGYEANWRYTLQRTTAWILIFFIVWHVFHMHGWFHWDWWLGLIEPLGGYKFRPYNAASSAGLALQSPLVALLYGIGVAAGVFHFVNGIWTAGITWGIWTRPAAQRRALGLCAGIGVVLLAVGMGALVGMRVYGTGDKYEEALATENRMYEAAVTSGAIAPNEHKRTHQESQTESVGQGDRS
jgi:succinate dehydrogenase / fumarate reductase cytochrome b subunit